MSNLAVEPIAIAKIVAELRGESSLQLLQSMLDELPECTSSDREEIQRYFNNRIKNITESLEDLVMDGDESQARDYLPLIWLELRIEWNRYNDQMQYQTMTLGTAKPILMARGACLSHVVGMVETYVDSEDLFWVNKIAIGAIESAKIRTRLNNRFLDLADGAERGMREALEVLFQTREVLETENVTRNSISKVDQCIGNVVNAFSRAIWFNSDDLHEIILNLVASGLKGAPLRMVLNPIDIDKSLKISPEVATCFRKVCEIWIKELFQNGFEANLNERTAAGKSPHLNLGWSLKSEKGRLSFELIDDGSATCKFPIDSRQFSNIGLRWRYEANSSQGGTLRFSCDEKSLHEFLVIRQRVDERDLFFGISANSVVRVEKKGEVISLDADRLILRSAHGKEIPVVDLEFFLSDKLSDQKSKKIVVVDQGEQGHLGIRADEICGILRGSLKPCVGIARSRSILGTVLDCNRLIHVIDINDIGFTGRKHAKLTA